METDRSTQFVDEPNLDGSKMETERATSSKPEGKTDCPILSLPPDILSKIIVKIPVAQWPSLELLDTNFQAATLIAWRQLRNVNVDRAFQLQRKNRLSFGEKIESILRKLVERSPFLTSLDADIINSDDPEFRSTIVQLLAQFERLQSIVVGKRGTTFDAMVEFLESTRSRTSLKEVRFRLNTDYGRADHAAILHRLISSFVYGRGEVQSPLKLETFSLMGRNWCPILYLATMDATRLTDLRILMTWIEPEQVTSLIERALNLRRIEFPFLFCTPNDECLSFPANQRLLSALASHENLTAIKFGRRGTNTDCTCLNFKPEFIQMLETIGSRGRIQKLSGLYGSHVCTTIREYIPYLQSIKIHLDDINEQHVSDIVSLTELQDLYLKSHPYTAACVVIEKIGQLSRLKRLALIGNYFVCNNSYKCLTAISTLMDLRIGSAKYIGADVYEKWSEGLASNLHVLMLSGVGEVDKEDVHNYANVEQGLISVLEKAARLRVLILTGRITDRSLMAIAKSCPELEILGVRSASNAITVRHLQEVVDRCPKLWRLGGFKNEIRNQLQFPKYRNIYGLHMEFWMYDYDDNEYDY